jgi:NAD(P)-dependent dehydrogenase (short-subunit alcohol dehydrogenase family)/acyl carrier protein
VLGIVDAGALLGPDADPAEATARGYGNLLALARALDSRASTTLRMTVVADRLLDVAGESPVMPEKAMLLGPLKVLPQEYPGLACRAIDVIQPETPRAREALARQVLHELDSGRGGPLVALRNRHRWVPSYQPVRPSEIPEGPGIRAGGVYLVTGGLGGVGLVVAQILAEAGAKLVLVSRSGTAGRAPETLAALASIEATAGGVDIAVADVADAEAMAGVVRRTQRRFGPILGVVHAAGETREGTVSMPLGEIGPRQTAVALHARAQGLRVLDQVLAEQPIEFALAISSNAAVLGGLGFGAYAGACHCMDALAAGAGARLPWISANWDRWPTLRAVRTYTETRTSIDRYAFSRAEAAEALGWLTRRAWRGQVVVSAGDLSARLARWVAQPLTTEARSASGAVTSSPAPDGTGPALVAGNAATTPAPGDTGSGSVFGDKPAAASTGDKAPAPMAGDKAGAPVPGDKADAPGWRDKAAAPSPGDKATMPAPGDRATATAPDDKATAPIAGDDIEASLIALFRDLIGARDIGPHDNFFELGGDSLVGIQLIARAGQTFGVRLPVESLFENPTLAALAGCVRTLRHTLPAPAGAPALVLSDGEEEGEI